MFDRSEGRIVQKNRNRLLGSLKGEDFSLLSRYLREVSIEQGQILDPFRLMHWRQAAPTIAAGASQAQLKLMPASPFSKLKRIPFRAQYPYVLV
jgi:hypothetical protein